MLRQVIWFEDQSVALISTSSEQRTDFSWRVFGVFSVSCCISCCITSCLVSFSSLVTVLMRVDCPWLASGVFAPCVFPAHLCSMTYHPTVYLSPRLLLNLWQLIKSAFSLSACSECFTDLHFSSSVYLYLYLYFLDLPPALLCLEFWTLWHLIKALLLSRNLPAFGWLHADCREGAAL